MAAVEIRALRKSYGATVVVDGVDLEIEHGQLVCLLGPSGCGKTTTLRLLAGFLEPDGGEILVGGRLLSSAGKAVPPERRKMSMIFQSYAVWPHMTIFENVAYGLKLRGRLGRSEIEQRTERDAQLVKLKRERIVAEVFETSGFRFKQPPETVLRFLPPFILEREHVEIVIKALDEIVSATYAGAAPAGEQSHG